MKNWPKVSFVHKAMVMVWNLGLYHLGDTWISSLENVNTWVPFNWSTYANLKSAHIVNASANQTNLNH